MDVDLGDLLFLFNTFIINLVVHGLAWLMMFTYSL